MLRQMDEMITGYFNINMTADEWGGGGRPCRFAAACSDDGRAARAHSQPIRFFGLGDNCPQSLFFAATNDPFRLGRVYRISA